MPEPKDMKICKKKSSDLSVSFINDEPLLLEQLK
jgi:hypothetical protein